MIVSFDKLPEESRVWIYQSNRIFTAAELDFIKANANDFLNQWTAHGANLQAAIDIPYDRFLVIALNESLQSASGCSIDSSVRFIQNLEKQLGVILLDKMNVTYRNSNKIEYISLKDFRNMAKKKVLNSDVVVFNNLVLDKKEYKTLWEVPAISSWHARYF